MPAGEVVELRCTYDPATKGGNAPDGRKVKATMHWVSAQDAVHGRSAALQSAVHQARSRRGEFRRRPQSEFARSACPTPSSNRLVADNSGEPVQFERQGYFVRDRDSTPGRPVFNRTIGLRDTWAKVAAAAEPLALASAALVPVA